MEFKRKVFNQLKQWKKKVKRKPLLLIGARQIGKTTVLKAFGQKEYDDMIYLNLEKQVDIHSFFKGNKNPRTILENISLLHGKNIVAGKTLLIIDEIQECRDALIALKYFEEEFAEIHVLGAGSLLGLSIGNDRSFPVGKVEFLDMYPLSFSEYLETADSALFKSFQSFINQDEIIPIPEAFFNLLKKAYKEYTLFGGMPEVAACFLLNKSVAEAQKVQDEILRGYTLDFVKYADKTTSTKIQQIWNSIPSQLAKENKKFIYKAVRSGARAREYEEAIQWLIQAGLAYKVSRVEKPGIPLKAFEDVTAFKLYVVETGLLMRLAGLEPKTFIHGDQFFKEFKGSIAENKVAESLREILGRSPYYWTSNGIAEIDFLIEQSGNCIPIEVKSGEQTKAKSLATYKNKYESKLRVRISNLNLHLTDDLINIPLFYCEFVDVLIRRALENIESVKS